MAYWTCDVVDTQLQIFCGNVVLTGRAVGAYRLDGFSDIVVLGFIDHEFIFNQGAGGRVIFVFVSGACSFRHETNSLLKMSTFSSGHSPAYTRLNGSLSTSVLKALMSISFSLLMYLNLGANLFTYVEDDVRRVMITDLITWKHVGCQNVPNIGCNVVDSFTSITCRLIDI